MSPDSPETRLGRLEQITAKLEQRMDDLLDRLAGQFKDLDDDVRAFAPIVREVDAVKAELRFIVNAQRELQSAVGDLRMRMEKESQERREGQEKRRKEGRTSRTLLIVAAIGLFGQFLLSLSAVIAVLVS